jgi:hypothetical protein
MRIQQFPKAWFCEKVGGYMFYDSEGRLLNLGSLDAEITISDNWGIKEGTSKGLATATINIVVQIVNEEPSSIELPTPERSVATKDDSSTNVG